MYYYLSIKVPTTRRIVVATTKLTMAKFKISNTLLSLLCLQVFCAAYCHGSKILFLVPIGTKSHMNVFEPLIRAFAARGDDLTVIAPVNYTLGGANTREIIPIPLNKIFTQYPDMFEIKRQGIFAKLDTGAWDFIYDICDALYRMPELVRIIEEDDFDLVFVSAWLPCLDGMVHKLGVPYIKIVSMATPYYMAKIIGNRFPASFVPEAPTGLTHEMNFCQRLANFAFRVYETWVKEEIYRRKSEQVYWKHLGEDTPGSIEIGKTVSMFFSNSYFPLTYPRPLLPQEIEVGGMHCKPAKPLPKDLETFVSEASYGFIYFGMGSLVNTDKMPETIRMKFINVFSRLKQRVIWKWNSGKMDNLPANVRVSSWLPQQDLLGHPNIRVFMTHGGLLSTQEAAYHGVPLLGIPFFADQEYNMEQAAQGGYALQMHILHFSEQDLEGLLHQLLNNESYSSKAKELSAVIKDQMQTPLERAIFWTDYVIRHKGAQHLKSPARNLNILQYHCIDVMAFIAFILVLVLLTIFTILRICFQCIFYRKLTANVSKPPQNLKKTE